MAQSPAYYLQQAEVCAQAAEITPLENQRATLLRSQAAWLALAARELAVQAARAERQPAATKEHDDA
ncbi:MAG: hypothetical protein HOO94_08205 [Novosphingobium sp.]|uniref:hypothetical protein n=1 Tax=Novosphingobium sp. TaxID=1874826 RepID=UPI0017FD02B8|nr:hypothetical protein [Novosphingobium sp.]